MLAVREQLNSYKEKMMCGLKSRMPGKVQYRPVIAGNVAMQVKPVQPDTYAECKFKFALYEIVQRARDAGVACCCDEGEYA